MLLVKQVELDLLDQEDLAVLLVNLANVENLDLSAELDLLDQEDLLERGVNVEALAILELLDDQVILLFLQKKIYASFKMTFIFIWRTRK